MQKDLKTNSNPSSTRGQRESLFLLAPPKIQIPKMSISVVESLGEMPKSSIFPLSPKSPITSSKVSHLAMSCTLPSFKKSFGVSISPAKTNKNESGLFSLERKNSQMALLFHMDKPSFLHDASVADQLFREDYGNYQKKVESDDIGDVRKLDEWQMTFKRNKGLGGYAKYNELTEQFIMSQTKKREGKDGHDFPSVRQDLINRIVADSDDEDANKKMILKDKLPSIMSDTKAFLGEKLDQTNEEIKAGIRSLEVMQRENNKDILNDLITKKIKDYLKTIDVDEMTEEQLRVHVKKIAEGVVAQFKALKGPTGAFIVHNSVETTVKSLKGKKQDQERFFAERAKEKKRQDQVIVDYEMMEDLLMEKLELYSHNDQVLQEKVRELTIESYNLKKEAMGYQSQIEEIHKKFGSLLNDGELSDPKTSSLTRNTAARRYGLSLMDAQAMRVEKKLEITGLTQKIMTVKDKFQLKNQDVKLKENELENNKTQKEYLKTQLRELYFKCLKDEVALIKEKKTPLSYAWVIRSLWKMHEEVKEYSFPGFLDSYSIKFILEYAKAQDELEEFCKTNNVMNLISHAEDFKTLSKTLDFNQASTQAATNNLSSHRTNLEPLNFQKIKKRDLNEMIEEMKHQIADCKKGNLKAKRQVPVQQYAHSKAMIYKWEDVDPYHIDKIIPSNLDSGELNQENKTFNIKISEKQKIAWEQGVEKFKLMLASRKKEMDRLFKQNIGKELDERLKATLLKTFHFLFGKVGPETFSRFLREKSGYDVNAQGKANKANLTNSSSKPNSIPTSPKSLNSSSLKNNNFQAAFGDSFYKGGSVGLLPKSGTASLYFNQPRQSGQQDSARNPFNQSAYNGRRSTTATESQG